MKRWDRTDSILLGVAVSGFAILAISRYWPKNNELGVSSRPALNPPARPLLATRPHPSETAGADAHLSPAKTGTPGDSPRETRIALPSTDGVSAGASHDQATVFQGPSAEALSGLTLDLWSQPEFRAARALPTLDDCELGIEDPIASEALALYTRLSRTLGEAWAWPEYRRGERYENLVRSLEASRAAAGWVLFMRLDEVTSFREWTSLWQEYEEWASE